MGVPLDCARDKAHKARLATPPAASSFFFCFLGERVGGLAALAGMVSVVFRWVGWVRWARRFSAARNSLKNVRLEMGADDCFQALTLISNNLGVD